MYYVAIMLHALQGGPADHASPQATVQQQGKVGFLAIQFCSTSADKASLTVTFNSCAAGGSAKNHDTSCAAD